MSPRRLTRAEQREKTRGCLVEAAAKVFTRRGYDKASLDEVAEEAGFTKGAVYSNFKGKEDLFLATIDAHFEERLRSIKRVMQEEPDEQGTAHAAGGGSFRITPSAPEVGFGLEVRSDGRPVAIRRKQRWWAMRAQCDSRFLAAAPDPGTRL